MDKNYIRLKHKYISNPSSKSEMYLLMHAYLAVVEFCVSLCNYILYDILDEDLICMLPVCSHYVYIKCIIVSNCMYHPQQHFCII